MNAQASVVSTFGPDGTDEVPILKICRTIGCWHPPGYRDQFCDKCRGDIDSDPMLRRLYPTTRKAGWTQ